ncbi:MAG TPA: ABC transporter permease, partial [Cytophagaceae bacterium]
MLKNYFKIAIAVFKRRKFFTFISLFGITFTLTILIVITALMQHLFGSTYPELKRERCLYIEKINERSEDGFSQRGNPPSFLFLDTYVSPMKTPVKKAFCS